MPGTEAPDTINFGVTQTDINAGVKGLTTKCPVALALARATGKHVCVTFFVASIEGLGLYRLSDAAYQFIVDFDAGKPVQPATFRVSRAY